MASTALSVNVTVTCTTGLEYQAQKYANLHLLVLSVFCADLILGLDFQSQNKIITIQYGDAKPPLSICGISTLNMNSAELLDVFPLPRINDLVNDIAQYRISTTDIRSACHWVPLKEEDKPYTLPLWCHQLEWLEF